MKKKCTSRIWRSEIFEGKWVKRIRVRIFEASKTDRIEVYQKDFIKHDGNQIGVAVTDFSYILISSGIQKANNTNLNDSYYVHIVLYITSDFNEKVLDNIDRPEIKYVKEFLEIYYMKKEIEEDVRIKELQAFMQRIDEEKVYDEIIEAIRTVDIHQIERSLLESYIPLKYKALVWEKTAKIAATKKQ